MVIAFVSIGYLAVWFLTAQHLRYFLVAFPGFCACSAYAYERVLAVRLRSTRFQWSAAAAAVLANIAYLYFTASDSYVKGIGPIPTSSAQQSFLQDKMTPSYPAYVVLNQFPPGRLYALHDSAMNYFYKGTFMGDWFGPGRYSSAEEHMRSGRDFYQYLRGIDANYLLINKLQTAQEWRPMLDDFFRQHFDPVYDGPAAVAYVIDSHKKKTVANQRNLKLLDRSESVSTSILSIVSLKSSTTCWSTSAIAVILWHEKAIMVLLPWSDKIRQAGW